MVSGSNTVRLKVGVVLGMGWCGGRSMVRGSDKVWVGIGLGVGVWVGAGVWVWVGV